MPPFPFDSRTWPSSIPIMSKPWPFGILVLVSDLLSDRLNKDDAHIYRTMASVCNDLRSSQIRAEHARGSSSIVINGSVALFGTVVSLIPLMADLSHLKNKGQHLIYHVLLFGSNRRCWCANESAAAAPNWGRIAKRRRRPPN